MHLRHISCLWLLPQSKVILDMNHRFTIDALNELIAARRDGERGLRICIEHVRSSRLRALLLSYLQSCARDLHELQSLVRLLGRGALSRPEWPPRACAEHGQRSAIVGWVEDPGTVPNTGMERRWAELRAALACAALACNEEGVILEEYERGESRALEVYRNALDDPLPEFVRATVLRQFEDVMSNRDQIWALRSEPWSCVEPGANSSAQAGQH